jgi:hypothetical protein
MTKSTTPFDSLSKEELIQRVETLIGNQVTPFKQMKIAEIPTWILKKRLMYDHDPEYRTKKWVERDMVIWGFREPRVKRSTNRTYDPSMPERFNAIMKKNQTRCRLNKMIQSIEKKLENTVPLLEKKLEELKQQLVVV